MDTSSRPQPGKPNTAVFMRAVLPSIDESQILCCPSCGKATVPVPDPQRSMNKSHCYRCGMEFAVGSCETCGTALFIGPDSGGDENPPTCVECGG
jgi:uncharacterized C2H2 Zn-finger protein